MNLGETELSLKKLVVSARIASYHVLGSPLTLPVMKDPLAVLAKLGLRPAAATDDPC